jgi:hypothetical protein
MEEPAGGAGDEERLPSCARLHPGALHEASPRREHVIGGRSGQGGGTSSGVACRAAHGRVVRGCGRRVPEHAIRGGPRPPAGVRDRH